MAFDAKRVFLVSGQALMSQEGGGEWWSPTIEQHVIVAEDELAAYALVDQMMPQFKPVGLARLDDYERAVAKIKATLNGNKTGWRLTVAPNLSA